MWQPATVAVTEVLHDRRQRPPRTRGSDQPAGDPVPAPAAEPDVEDVDQAQLCVVRCEPGLQGQLAGVVEGPRPEGVEIGLLVAIWTELTQLGQGFVEHRHGRQRT